MSVKIKLNGESIEASEGKTILQAAREAGVEIPNLCSYENHTNGVCRICLVEVGNPGRMVPSCSTTVSENMEIQTETGQLKEYRKGLLSLAMKEHPEHTGKDEEKCKLEDYAELYSVPTGRQRSEFQVTIDESHPGIAYDPALCIMCRKCVIACDQDQVNEVIAISGRGAKSKIVFDLDAPMGKSSCASCGACVDSCPTGALIEKGWEPAERTEVSICPYCAVGCSVEYGIKGDSIIWARGYSGSDVNNGKLCVKGKFGWEFEMSKDRLTVPLIRKKIGDRAPLNGQKIDDVFRKATWDEALDLVAEKIRQSRGLYGSRSLGGIACDRATNEDVYAFQKFMRAALGTDNVDQSATLCHAPSAAMLSYATGAGASTNSMEDVRVARTIIMVGSNVDRAHPVLSSEIKQAARNGARLIIVDPRKVELTNHAYMHLLLKPGTDVVLFSAMAKFILDNKLEDRKFIQERTENFEEFEQSLSLFTLEYASKVTGISESDIARVATMYAKDGPAIIFWTLGITEHENGSDNVSSLINLAFITGNVGKPGTGLSPIRGQNNVQGGADMGAVAGSLPGYQPISSSDNRAKFGNMWKVELPENPGWKSTEMIDAAEKGLLKLMYITGENSVRSHPDTQGTIDALRKLDFLIVQDIFLTETAELADVVLPAASTFEKSGTFTNTERRVQLTKKIFDPPGEALPDWEIYTRLAQRLDYDLRFNSSSNIMDEIASLVPTYAGISHDRLTGNGLQWPVRDKSSGGTKLLHTESFMRGKGRFRLVSWRERDAVFEKTYPYNIIIGRQREHYHTATMTARSRVIRGVEKGSYLEMNPDDMVAEKINEGQEIEVQSKTGKVRGSAKANSDVPSGIIFTTFHYSELPTNFLTPPTFDPPTKTPAYKDTRVKIVKV